MDRLNPSSTRVSGNDVFISYSRRDQAFVRQLDAAFRQLNREPWVDWDGIQKGEEWWQAIQRGIEGADTFVFVISPDSIASSVCRDEIDHAAHHNKRFLPIVRREGFDMQQVHPRVSSHNWLFFRETDDFGVAFRELQRAIDADLGHARTHTRLLVRAIEWQEKDYNSSYLLRGADLEEAQRWLLTSTGKEPQPTDQQVQYINAGIKAAGDRLKTQRKTRRTVVLATILANLLMAVAGGWWFYQHRMNEAKEAIRADMVKALQIGAAGIDGDEFNELAYKGLAQGKAAAIASPLYQQHQNWLASIRRVFPDTFARTYVGGSPGKVRWIGDVSRMVPGMKAKTQFFDYFPADLSERNALAGQETVIMEPYKDELGEWISASGPVKNSAGQVVGGMRVDYSKSFWMKEQANVRNMLAIAYLLVGLWLILLSAIILRAMRPTEGDL